MRAGHDDAHALPRLQEFVKAQPAGAGVGVPEAGLAFGDAVDQDEMVPTHVSDDDDVGGRDEPQEQREVRPAHLYAEAEGFGRCHKIPDRRAARRGPATPNEVWQSFMEDALAER